MAPKHKTSTRVVMLALLLKYTAIIALFYYNLLPCLIYKLNIITEVLICIIFGNHSKAHVLEFGPQSLVYIVNGLMLMVNGLRRDLIQLRWAQWEICKGVPPRRQFLGEGGLF